MDLEEEGTGDTGDTGGNNTATCTDAYAPAASSSVLPGAKALPVHHAPATRPPCPRDASVRGTGLLPHRCGRARPLVSIPRDGEPLPAGGGMVLPIGRLR